MKKLGITLCILIALGAFAFFYGWAQLTVPPGAYGLVRSKTHGDDPRPVRSGEFRWIWYKLIPTNVEITTFRLEPVTHRFTARNTLPSGDAYAAFAGTGADFSWELNASLSFSIDPGALVALVSDNGIGSQEALDAWEQRAAEQMGAYVLGRLSSGEMDAGRLEEILKTGSSAELEGEIQGRFPAVSKVSCVVNAAKFPDFVLYRQVRGLYEDFIARQREYVSTALGRQAENRIETQLRFDELEQYGALLVKYPVLLEYLALERGMTAKSE
jgi:hypothetical protein